MKLRWVEATLEVRFNECDPMGVAHHANYFIWFEVGRLALAREAKINVSEMARQQVFMPVVHSECQYKKSARFGQRILIRTALLPPEAARLEFHYQVLYLPGHVFLAQGRTVHVVLVAGQGLLLQLPPEFREKVEAFLAG